MFIEYDLRLEKEVYERGIINAEYVKWVQVQRHGGGYGKAIEVYYDGYETKSIFICNDEVLFEKVYGAFKKALTGGDGEIEGIGFVKPLHRAPYWGADHVAIPVTSELDLDKE